MRVNADFDQPVLISTANLEWQASPMAGVDRRMLDRMGDEVARATSIVRYAKGSAFSEHTHSGGEEFIVLEGVFQDEHGDYPAGTYVRNPIGTRHVPRSEPGCTIFVKLWQFAEHDQEQLSIDLNAVVLDAVEDRPGVQSATLAKRDYETVAIEHWDANWDIELSHEDGFEILILDGTLSNDSQEYGPHDWIRWPADRSARFTSGDHGARIWIKRGHLRNVHAPTP